MNTFLKIIFCTLSIVFSQATLPYPSNDINFDTDNFRNEMDSLDDIITVNGKGHLNEWKVIKGLAGLLIGTKCFFAGSTGIVFSLIFPDKLLFEQSSSPTISSRLENFLTNRLLWLSLSSAVTIFSLWLLKKSVANIYYGFNGNRK